MHLGIDFGTCFSSAAFISQETLALVKDSASLNYSIPSSVFVTLQGEVLVGRVAENRRLTDPLRYRKELKRDLGKDLPLPFGNQTFRVEELITHIIGKVKRDADTLATNMRHEPFMKAVLTIPATYQNRKRELMHRAAIAANFTQRGIKLLEEPTAAALYYAQQNRIREGEILLVYDLGGGTFDTALLQKRGENFEYLAIPAGIERCGGVDFDRAIYNDLVRQHPGLQTILRVDRQDQMALIARLMVGELCIRLKHQLSEVDEAEETMVVPGDGSLLVHRLTRTAFQQMIAPFIQQTIASCRKMVQSADISYEQIHQIVLVGGSCRIPYVQQMLLHEFNRPINAAPDLELVVCQGAALYTPEEQYEVSPIARENGYTTISAALQAAEPRSRILVSPGTYQENVVIDKEIAIIGVGSRETIIIESNDEPCITMGTDTAQVRGMTLRQTKEVAMPDHSSAVYVPQGSLHLEDCEIASADGIGIHSINAGSYIELQHCSIHGCNEGVSISQQAIGFLENCEIYDNQNQGITIGESGSDAVIKTSLVHDNNDDGISLYRGAQAKIEDCEIYSNILAGVHFSNEITHPTLTRCKIYNSRRAGVELDDGAQGHVEACDIFENADAGVSIVDEESDPVFIQCTIHHNRGVGVKVRDGAEGTFEGCQIFSNGKAGVSVADEDSNPVFKQCQIHDGSSSGIKIKEEAQGRFEDCDIYNNSEYGIDITNAGTNPLIRRCFIHDNEEDGIFISNNAEGLIEECDVYDNVEDGIYITGDETKPTFERCQTYNNEENDLNVSYVSEPTLLNCYIKDNSGGLAYPSVGRKLRRLR